jgi:hypothetical protein
MTDYYIDFKIFIKEYRELIREGKTYEDAMSILKERYGGIEDEKNKEDLC